MKRSPSQPKSNVIHLPGGVALHLRPVEEVRSRLLDVDFSTPREWSLSQSLAACGARLGSVEDPTPAHFHDMPLAQRHWLVGKLLLLEGVAVLDLAEVCRHCGELLELRLELQHAMELARGKLGTIRSGSIRLEGYRLRLPTAADLDAVEDAASLLRACVPVDSPHDAAALEAAESALRDADPLGELALHAACCQCGEPVRAVVDLPVRWLRMQAQKATMLFEEIDTLARHYHWPEAAILSLPPGRRVVYLELCRTRGEPVRWEEHAFA